MTFYNRQHKVRRDHSTRADTLVLLRGFMHIRAPIQRPSPTSQSNVPRLPPLARRRK